jgi:hypothetical protein
VSPSYFPAQNSASGFRVFIGDPTATGEPMRIRGD